MCGVCGTCEEERLEGNTKLQKQDGGAWTRLSGSCECDNRLFPLNGGVFVTNKGVSLVTTTIKASGSWDCVCSYPPYTLWLVMAYLDLVMWLICCLGKINIFVLAFKRRNFVQVHIFQFLMEIRWMYPGYLRFSVRLCE
jgi:hypothetical protein